MKMHKYNLLTAGLIFSVSALMESCSDFLEKNLQKEKIVVSAPSDNYTSPSLSITFWWEEVKGARDYTIQVVKPSFLAIQEIILDTITTGTKLQYSFQPGDSYQWRIRAQNGSSQTDWFTYRFSIDSTLDLSNQVVQLLSPTDNTVSNQLTHLFRWGSIYFADDYRFEILNSSGNVTDVKGAVLTDTASYAFKTEGIYKWRVQAHNDAGSVSSFSVPFTITIDTTAPGTPLLVSPPNNGNIILPGSLSWTRTSPGITTVRDSVLIFSDSLQSVLVKYGYTSKDSSTMRVDSLAKGIYFWKVRTVDAAGNMSPYSSSFRFSVQ